MQKVDCILADSLIGVVHHRAIAAVKNKADYIGYINPNPPHTHSFSGPFSGTTWVSRYQKGKTNLDFTEARDSEWQWHQLGNTQVCTLLQTENHASIPRLSFFTGRMPFLPPNQQCQSTEALTLTPLNTKPN